jgi:hypothetical protein
MLVKQVYFLFFITHLLSIIFSDYKKGQELITNRSFEDNQEFFQKIFEIGRRHKIMNPEKMRDAYGKLMYMLMVRRSLLFTIVLRIYW